VVLQILLSINLSLCHVIYVVFVDLVVVLIFVVFVVIHLVCALVRYLANSIAASSPTSAGNDLTVAQ